MKHKTAELTGALLDAAVAKAEGFPSFWIDPGDESREAACVLGPARAEDSRFDWSPSSAWEQAGPIIEREQISMIIDSGFTEAFVNLNTNHGELAERDASASGPTPLIAAMRAFVAHKLGDEVEL